MTTKDAPMVLRAIPNGISVTVTDEQLVLLSESGIDMIGRMITESLSRRQAHLVCERDGHQTSFGVCTRCWGRVGALPDA